MGNKTYTKYVDIYIFNTVNDDASMGNKTLSNNYVSIYIFNSVNVDASMGNKTLSNMSAYTYTTLSMSMRQ